MNELEILSPKEKKMVEAGLTREKSYRKIVDMMEAKTMVLDKFGGEHFSEDNPTQLRAAEMHLKMTGDIKPENFTENKVVNVNISSGAFDKMVEWVKDMRAQMVALKSSGQQTGEIIDVRAE
jgi:nicotinate-nucleotide pyrophosphorylase